MTDIRFRFALTLALLAPTGNPFAQRLPDPDAALHSRRAWHRVALFGSNLDESPQALSDAEAAAGRVRVLLMTQPGDHDRAHDQIIRWVDAHHGTIEFADTPTGYARVVVAADAVAPLIGQEGITSWQLAGISSARASDNWERVDPRFPHLPRQQAERRRAMDAEGMGMRDTRRAKQMEALRTREVIPRELTERHPYQADSRMGVDRLAALQPTFDGRGVTIAFVESNVTALPVWHPLLQKGLTLDGREVRKVTALHVGHDPGSEANSRVAVAPLSPAVLCRSTICVIGGARYILPAPGRYRLGLLSSPSKGQDVAILRDEAGLLRMDTDADRDFTDEKAVRDFNTCDDSPTDAEPGAGCGRFTPANGEELLLSEDPDGERVIVHRVGSAHAVMIATIAAGHPQAGTFGRGIAPGARVVLVGIEPEAFHSVIEGLILAARLKEVDVVSVSTHYAPEGAATDAFNSRILDRIVQAYRKPMVFSAGNNGGGLATEVTATPPSVLAAGSLAQADVVRAVEGFESKSDEWVVPQGSNRGPTADGALKPDVVIPNRVVAGATCTGEDPGRLLATMALPRCYTISSGTSAAAPGVAGLLARLISGLKQQGRPVDPERLAWAIRASSVPVPGVPAIGQGLGVPQLDAAWKLYTSDAASHRVIVEAPVRHVMDDYLRDKDRAAGLFERENWSVGRRGERMLTLHRLEGPAERSAFRLTLRGDADTFNVPSRITLPIGQRVAVPVGIKPRRAGVHSAVIELREQATGQAVAFVPLTVVVGEEATSSPNTHTGELGPFSGDFVYSRIPTGTHLVRIDLEVLEGSITLEADVPTGRNYSAPRDLLPFMFNQPKPAGRYTLLLPEPEAGTWAWTIASAHAARADSVPRSRYKFTVRRIDASLQSQPRAADGGLDVSMNAAAIDSVRQPELVAEAGSMIEQTLPFHTGVLPTVTPIAVAEDTDTLIVRADAASARRNVAMTLYDCTTGHCVLFDDRLPLQPFQQMRISRPSPGTWKVIVAPGPGPADSEESVFKLKTVTTHGGPLALERHPSKAASWIVPARPVESGPALATAGTPVLLLGLLDRDAVDAERLNPIGRLDLLTTRPAFVATEIVPWSGHRQAPQTSAYPASGDR